MATYWTDLIKKQQLIKNGFFKFKNTDLIQLKSTISILLENQGFFVKNVKKGIDGKKMYYFNNAIQCTANSCQ